MTTETQEITPTNSHTPPTSPHLNSANVVKAWESFLFVLLMGGGLLALAIYGLRSALF
ncbi:hypothetical protein [Thioflexithrix psekupsensis]|uniref:hypothetical protein n=1 Tax=Thioflexithrix psekupsensis TaxID=1570016 RepID=UPI001592E47E|nr:hypothetical protein [Thioflexithrix psekupsensis]